MEAAQQYIAADYRWEVDLDLEKIPIPPPDQPKTQREGAADQGKTSPHGDAENVQGPAPDQPKTYREEAMVPEKSLPPTAAYALLFLTTICIAAAFWMVLSERGAAIARPAFTVLIAGLAGGLVCVSTRDTRSFDKGQWILAVYSWLLTAFTGASTSLGLFILSSIAFPLTGTVGFQYAGLGLFGAITGYLGASVAMAGALSWGPSLKSPLDQVTREVNLQMERILPSLQPRVSRLMEEAILGPPIPPYNGYVAVTSNRHSEAAGTAGEQLGIDFAVWFDTVRLDAGVPTGPERGLSRKKVYPINLRGQGSRAESPLKGDQEHGIPFDVLLHIPSAAASPIRRSVTVPLSGRSAPLAFSLASTDLEKGALPPDTFLELRCRGALIQIIELHDLERASDV